MMIFDVKVNWENALYTGQCYNRPAATANDFITLKPEKV